MTVSSALNRVAYNGTGALTPLVVSFPFAAQADLVVIETVILTGVSITLVLNSDYSISGTTDDLGHYSNGGTVTPLITFPTTVRWTIYRDPSPLQTLNLTENDNLPAESVEAQLDFLTMLVQRTRDLVGRTLRQPDGDPTSIDVLPSAVARASKYLLFDASGNPTASSVVTVGAITVSAYMETVLTAADAAAARGLLVTFAVIDAAGDLIYGSAADTAARLAIGTARQVLTVNAGATAPTWANPITLATPQATTSGTSIDFTNIPAGVRRITVNFKGNSISDSSSIIVQIGDPGGIEPTGYVSAIAGATSAVLVASTTSTVGFLINATQNAAHIYNGSLILTLENASTFSWIGMVTQHESNSNSMSFGAGRKSLSAELDRVRITTPGGTATFDAGEININFE